MPRRSPPRRRRARIGNLIDGAVQVGDVKLAVRVLAEGADRHARSQQRSRGPRSAATLRGAEDRTAAVIAVEVDVVHGRISRAVIAVAAGDRALPVDVT